MHVNVTQSGEYFPEADELKRHLMIHTSKVLWQCNICRKKILNKRQLEAHIKAHIV